MSHQTAKTRISAHLLLIYISFTVRYRFIYSSLTVRLQFTGWSAINPKSDRKYQYTSDDENKSTDLSKPWTKLTWTQNVNGTTASLQTSNANVSPNGRQLSAPWQRAKKHWNGVEQTTNIAANRVSETVKQIADQSSRKYTHLVEQKLKCKWNINQVQRTINTNQTIRKWTLWTVIEPKTECPKFRLLLVFGTVGGLEDKGWDIKFWG